MARIEQCNSMELQYIASQSVNLNDNYNHNHMTRATVILIDLDH